MRGDDDLWRLSELSRYGDMEIARKVAASFQPFALRKVGNRVPGLRFARAEGVPRDSLAVAEFDTDFLKKPGKRGSKIFDRIDDRLVYGLILCVNSA